MVTPLLCSSSTFLLAHFVACVLLFIFIGVCEGGKKSSRIVMRRKGRSARKERAWRGGETSRTVGRFSVPCRTTLNSASQITSLHLPIFTNTQLSGRSALFFRLHHSRLMVAGLYNESCQPKSFTCLYLCVSHFLFLSPQPLLITKPPVSSFSPCYFISISCCNL